MTYCFSDAIGEARKTQGYSLPIVIASSEFIARCQFAPNSRYILFKNKECIGIYDSVHEMRESHDNIDVSKGWYPAEINDTIWARSQSLTGLQWKLDKRHVESKGQYNG